MTSVTSISMFRVIKRILKKLLISILRFKWLLTSGANNEFTQKAHLLLVKDTKYIYFARICAESFLHHHPNSSLIIHCDSTTFDQTLKYFRITSKIRNISILNDARFDTSWQESKLKLLLSLAGSEDIYVDSDLRWNGSIKPIKSVCFFVQEFRFTDSNEYKKLFNLLKRDLDENKFMWNTSFFTFGGAKLPFNVEEKIWDFYKEFNTKLQTLEFKDNHYSQKLRLSEQISISYYADEISDGVISLKLNDARLDGSVAESVYFGSTGLGF